MLSTVLFFIQRPRRGQEVQMWEEEKQQRVGEETITKTQNVK